MSVKVTDANNNLVLNSNVAFTPVPVSGATATLSASQANTGATGIATITATSGSTVGSYTVNATINGVTAVFHLTNTVGPASTIAILGSYNAAPVVNSNTTLVAVVKDAGGNVVSGVNVAWASQVGSGGANATSLTPTSVATAAAGNANTVVRANQIAGPFTVTATATGVTTPATFAITSVAGAPAFIFTTNGNNQTTVVNQVFASILTAHVTDAQQQRGGQRQRCLHRN